MAFIRKVLQKLEEPMGAPSTRSPSVTSHGVKFPLVSFVLISILRVSGIVPRFRGQAVLSVVGCQLSMCD
eukprot:scaffold60422_cov37-Cyclotella_meneghiniana.AAC.3